MPCHSMPIPCESHICSTRAPVHTVVDCEPTHHAPRHPLSPSPRPRSVQWSKKQSHLTRARRRFPRVGTSQVQRGRMRASRASSRNIHVGRQCDRPARRRPILIYARLQTFARLQGPWLVAARPACGGGLPRRQNVRRLLWNKW